MKNRQIRYRIHIHVVELVKYDNQLITIRLTVSQVDQKQFLKEGLSVSIVRFAVHSITVLFTLTTIGIKSMM